MITRLPLFMLATLAGIAIAGCSHSAADPEKGKAPAANPIAARSTAPARSGDWPAWRGPNGDAISSETNWTSEWPADGPKKLWTAQVGIGFSAISVAQGRAYTMGPAPHGP